MLLRGILLALLVVVAGCELRDVVVAEPQDVIIAEIVLRTDQRVQRALLHHTLQSQDSVAATVPGARIEVSDSRGNVFTFIPVSDRLCIDDDPAEPHVPYGSCYATDPHVDALVDPGETYTLRITLADGSVMTGTTHVPGDLHFTRPTVPTCALPAYDSLRIGWTSAPGAWVYAAETILHGLGPFFAQQNITVDDPLRLFGLSASAQDTTIVFPKEFGVFQRFDPDLTDVLAVLQKGLPPGIVADVVVAAADRNYVNWERGGDFNPSGSIRVPSIRGAGTGEFGSLVPHGLQIRIGATIPAC